MRNKCLFLHSIIASFMSDAKFSLGVWHSWKDTFGRYDIFAKKSYLTDEDGQFEVGVVVVEKEGEFSETLLYNHITSKFFPIVCDRCSSEEAMCVADFMIDKENNLMVN